MPKVLQRDIEELESYYHSGDFVGYDCCLETLEATVRVETVKQCALYAKLLCKDFCCTREVYMLFYAGNP